MLCRFAEHAIISNDKKELYLAQNDDKNTDSGELFDEIVNTAVAQFQDLELLREEAYNLREENEKLHSSLDLRQTSDSLTSLYNRETFYELGDVAFKSSKRYKSPLSGILLDIDWFKDLNDRSGHLAGDHLITIIGEIIASSVREIDITGRFAGGTFALLLPHTPLVDSAKLAERLREKISGTDLPEQVDSKKITASLGVGQVDEKSATFDDFMVILDNELYTAKNEGRNQVSVHECLSD